jgi:hypothetical protein
MKGKIEFGCDYLNIMRSLEYAGSPREVDLVADAAARVFLLNWGFSVEEIDEANSLYLERLKKNELEGDLSKVAKRIADHIAQDKTAQDRLVTELAAVSCIDDNVTSDEAQFVKWFEDILDIRPSEFAALCDRGFDWAVALKFFGDAYADRRSASTK